LKNSVRVILAKQIGAKTNGMALASVAFALSGFMIAWLGHPHTNAACLLPAFFWALHLALDAHGFRSWVWVAGLVCLLIFSGHPPTWIQIWTAGLAYVLYMRPGKVGAFILATIGGVALAAPILLPYLEYYLLSSTGAASMSLARWSSHLSPMALLHILMPLASGSPIHGNEALAAVFGLDAQNNFLERAGWVGLPVLAFAAHTVAKENSRKEVIFLAGMMVLCLAAAIGLPPWPWIWRSLPGFSSINPTRLLLLFTFGACLLAGLGCDDSLERPSCRWKWGLVIVVLTAVMINSLAVLRVFSELTPTELGFSFGQALFFIIEAGIAFWLITARGASRWAPWMTAAILLRIGTGINPTVSGERMYPSTPATAIIAQEQGEGRFLGFGATLAPDTGMSLGLRDARGRDFSTLKRYEELLTGQAGDFNFFQETVALPVVSPLLALSTLATTPRYREEVPSNWTLIPSPDLLIYRAPRSIRRALFVPEARAETAQKILTIVRDAQFDPEQVLWIDGDSDIPHIGGGKGSAKIQRENSNEVIVEVESNGPGWIVLLDNWYPGWRAQVNGRSSKIYRADYTFRAVSVPSGTSTVRFFFVPSSFWIGVIIALTSTICLAWAVRRA
jgi:hypothetical protein